MEQYIQATNEQTQITAYLYLTWIGTNLILFLLLFLFYKRVKKPEAKGYALIGIAIMSTLTIWSVTKACYSIIMLLRS